MHDSMLARGEWVLRPTVRRSEVFPVGGVDVDHTFHVGVVRRDADTKVGHTRPGATRSSFFVSDYRL